MNASETNTSLVVRNLLEEGPIVINIGLEEFARDLEVQGVAVVQVDWSPPAGGDPELAHLLSKLGT